MIKTTLTHKRIIADKEKLIIENFNKVFNRIKRIDETELTDSKISVSSSDKFKVNHKGKTWTVKYHNHEVGDTITLISGEEKLKGIVTKVTPDGDLTIKLPDSSVNEIFGFSKKEKQAKALKQDIEKAMLEIDNLDTSALFREINRNLNNEEIKNLSGIIKNNLINYLPTFVKICPEVLEDKGGSTNAVSASFDYKGENLRGITYSPLVHIIGTQISDNSKTELKQYLINKINQTSA